MSGGLDSTSVACLASRMIVPQKLKTISYVFDELPDCDERVFIKTVIDTWGIQSIQIPSDDLWPYKNLQDWPHNPNQPDGNLYRMVMERTYQRANREDLRVLLTGTYGDELYDGEEDWLYDLITEGRLRDAVHEINLHLRYTGLRRTWESAYLRRSIRHVIHQIPARKNLLDFFPRRSKQIFPAWLTPFSTESLSEEQHQFDPAYELKKNLLGSWTAGDCVNESYYTSCYGLELRHPYRDRRLVEYVLTLPAHQLYNHGQYKHVLRTAMQGILPEAIRTRSRPTTLHTLFARGMERERKIIQEYILDSDAAWRKYVRADWLKERWNIPVTIENDGVDKVVAWLCVSYARWYQTYR
jgi:asparagine synthase (glutamine-hydrolysing)